ncbi:MAG: hypothetical protein LHW57_04005 [Candidatus Cloacimonetes bacterium]|nr:hypothetical protein [Candidatus Cloacimonadota bacterium]
MRLPLLAAILIPLAFSPLLAQDLVIEQSFPLLPDQDTYQISPSPIISGSETVFADSLALIRGRDYQLDSRAGTLTLLRFPVAEYLRVSCILVPPELAQPRYLYRELEPSDSLFQSVAPRPRNWLPEDGKLLITGAKTFAVTFSDEDAFDLKQSLFVNLNGELSRNVNIAAQLSDSQSKLTPEGDSKELSSLDKVFIRVYGKQYEIAMGDLDWEFTGTRYINYRTSIEGLNAWYRDRHFAQAGFTASSGKPASQAIGVIDGKQGPYYLNPTGWQSSYLIIAGSEQIYRNGTLLERGTDYYIDYSEGSVMFRSLVVSSDQINAWFQYADEFYRQSTLFNSSRIQLLPGLALSHHFVRQVDAKDSPLLYEFSPADLDSLSLAGDRLAWGNGISQVEPGLGSYVLRTTGEGIPYYEYAAGDSSAIYNVTFSFVGLGNGDYEEFSSGKFRYLGAGLGSWLPQKRLVPAVARNNADLALTYESEALELGVEGIFTTNDKNTFSDLDDADNRGGLLSAWGRLQTGDEARESWIGLDFERRWANSFLFSQSSGYTEDYDLALLDPADSLAQWRIDLNLGSRAWSAFKPQLTARFKDIPGLYSQKALRLLSQSRGQGALPSLDLRSTLSWQDFAQEGLSSLMQYHELSGSWDLGWLKARLLGNYNSLEHSQAIPADSRYWRLNPQLTLGNAKTSLSQLSFIQDNTFRRNPDWISSASSQTYALKHSTASLNHNLSLDLTHRRITKEGPQNSYSLVSLRNSHYFLKQAVMLLGNYQLNQTEFFPRIRELEYIGDGLGLYDSTGVYTPDGDWDYVYITSGRGTLSSEVNGQLSLYLKPGNFFPQWSWIRGDLILQGTLQDSLMADWRSYLIFPETAFSAPSTIFGNQRSSQTLWLELVPGRVIGSLSASFNRSLDNRYQSQTRASEALYAAEFDLKKFWGNNFNLRYAHSNETDSRYLSDITLDDLGLLVQRNFSASNIGTLNLGAYLEKGLRQESDEGYSLRGLGLEPGYRGVWGKKARVNGSFGLRYNQRDGSDFLWFLPEKRAGLLLNWSVSAVYRLNSFSSATCEYSGTAYPDQDVKHTLKLEFKAEL